MANKKTYIANFRAICNKLNRTEDEVKLFFEKELATVISINNNGSLIITGIYKQQGILKILNNYILEFVTCKECKSCDTNVKMLKKL